jgi:hypothetical protein
LFLEADEEPMPTSWCIAGEKAGVGRWGVTEMGSHRTIKSLTPLLPCPPTPLIPTPFPKEGDPLMKVAFTTRDSETINAHFGSAKRIDVYEVDTRGYTLFRNAWNLAAISKKTATKTS